MKFIQFITFRSHLIACERFMMSAERERTKDFEEIFFLFSATLFRSSLAVLGGGTFSCLSCSSVTFRRCKHILWFGGGEADPFQVGAGAMVNKRIYCILKDISCCFRKGRKFCVKSCGTRSHLHFALNVFPKCENKRVLLRPPAEVVKSHRLPGIRSQDPSVRCEESSHRWSEKVRRNSNSQFSVSREQKRTFSALLAIFASSHRIIGSCEV